MWNVRLTGKDAAEPAFNEADWSFPVEKVFTACLQLRGSTVPQCLLARPRSLLLTTLSFHLHQEQRNISENAQGALRFSKSV